MAAVNAAKRRNAVLSESTFNFLTSVLLLKHPDGLDDAARAQRLDFVLRFSARELDRQTLATATAPAIN